MNILIIDNGTIRLDALKALIHENSYKILPLGELETIDDQAYDLIILSGSSYFPVLNNKELYKKEIDLILHSTTPIIGICLGFELIAYSYDAILHKLESKKNELIQIVPSQNTELFKDIQDFSVYEAHRWAIKQVPEDFVELARSADGIEVFKHKTRKIFGLQFHPEMFVEKSCGDEIFYNLLNVIKN